MVIRHKQAAIWSRCLQNKRAFSQKAGRKRGARIVFPTALQVGIGELNFNEVHSTT